MKSPLRLLTDTLGDIKSDYLHLHDNKLLTPIGETRYKEDIELYQSAIRKIQDESQKTDTQQPKDSISLLRRYFYADRKSDDYNNLVAKVEAFLVQS